jgi:hypothetical protein
MSQQSKTVVAMPPSRKPWRAYNSKVSGLIGVDDFLALKVKDVAAVIAGFKQGRVRSQGSGESAKLILRLNNSQGKPAFVDASGKGLEFPINSTNGDYLEELLNSKFPEDWVGRVIVLTVKRFKNNFKGGAMEDGVRVISISSHDKGPNPELAARVKAEAEQRYEEEQAEASEAASQKPQPDQDMPVDEGEL